MYQFLPVKLFQRICGYLVVCLKQKDTYEILCLICKELLFGFFIIPELLLPVIHKSYQNIGGDSTSYSFFDDIEVTFDDKYNYRMQQLDLDSSVMSQYWSCQPLKTVDIYWVQSVPDEVKTMGCNISFKVGETLYKY